jgi:hypothetical protein
MAVSVLAGLHNIESFAFFFKFCAHKKVETWKGVWHEIFALRFSFHESVSPRPSPEYGGHFEFLQKFAEIFEGKG